MNFFKRLGKITLGAVSVLTGFPLGGGSPVEKIAGVVDEYKYTEQEKAVDSKEDLEGARAFAAPGHPLGLIGNIVDGVNHAIRPWVTIELISILLGYKKPPDLNLIPPAFMTLIYIVITFWFGGRMVVRDIAPLIQSWLKGR